jgi:hypothetical protein
MKLNVAKFGNPHIYNTRPAIEDPDPESRDSLRDRIWNRQNSECGRFLPNSSLSGKHLQELLASGISESIAHLNARTLSGQSALNSLLYSPNLNRLNTGILSSSILKRYQHVEKGGWGAFGLDPLEDYEPMEWGCFKPDFPRADKDGKVIKYEHPPKDPTRAFFCDLGFEDALNIARKLDKEKKLIAEFEDKPPEITWGQAFWQWVQKDPSIPLVITEGFKKGAALMSWGIVAIALPGVTGGVRVERDGYQQKIGSHLIPELEPFIAEGRKFVIAFDADEKPKTIANVDREKFKLGHLLTKSGCEVALARWEPKDGKGIDDLIVNCGEAALDLVLERAVAFQRWSRRSRRAFTFKPDVEFNSPFFGEVSVPESAKLVALQGEKGTGKTKAISEILKQSPQPVLAITHLRSLCKENANRFGIQDIGDIRSANLEDRHPLKLLGYHEGMALVINSLHPRSYVKFEAEKYADFQVVLDEVVQLLDALLNSSTCREFRALILKEFTALIKAVLSPDSLGRLIISDADLSNKEVMLILKLAGVDLKPFVITNKWKAEKAASACIYKNDIHLLKQLETSLLDGDRVWVFSDNQKPKSRSSSFNVERLIKKKFPHLKVLRIDSETIEQRGHPAFGCIANLNSIVIDYDVVIVSPSVQTGVSIDVRGHFDVVFGCFHGVVSSDTARQALARVREPVPRHICIPAMGLTSYGCGELNADELRRNQRLIANQTFNAIGLAAANLMEIANGSQDIWLTYWSDRAAEGNRARICYRDYLINGLEDEGWRVAEVPEGADPEPLKELKQEVLSNRDLARQERAEEIAEAELIDSGAAALLEDCPTGVTEQQQRERDKHRLHSKYGGVGVTPDLCLKDDQKWHPKIGLHYYLTFGRETLKERDRRIVEKLSGSCSEPFLPDLVRSTKFAKVAALEALSIGKLANSPDFTSREWRNSDRDLIEIRERCLAHADSIQRLLGFKLIESDSPIRVAAKILKLLGLSLHCFKKEGGRGAQERVYRLLTKADFEAVNRARGSSSRRALLTYIGWEDGRSSIFDAWLNSLVVTEGNKYITTPRNYQSNSLTVEERAA